MSHGRNIGLSGQLAASAEILAILANAEEMIKSGASEQAEKYVEAHRDVSGNDAATHEKMLILLGALAREYENNALSADIEGIRQKLPQMKANADALNRFLEEKFSRK